MSVASLELCRTLHELSGWNDVSLFYSTTSRGSRSYVKKSGEVVRYTAKRGDYRVIHPNNGQVSSDSFPAYDLGYLLRKLPICTIIKKDSRSKYLAFAREKYVDVGMQTAKTPEDAVCKLAIELFKQGVLNKKEDKLDE